MCRIKSSYLLLIVILVGTGFPGISQAGAPILEEGQLALAPVDYLPPAMTDIDVVGNYAYVGAGPSLLVIDISDPANPQRVGYELLPGIVGRVMPVEGRVYVTIRNASGDRLLIYDSSQPENLRLIADHDLSALGWSALAVEGSRIYAAEADSVRILDATDPIHLVVMNVYTGPDINSIIAMHAQDGVLTLIVSIVENDTLAYSRYLLIIDMSDPNHTLEVGRGEISNDMSISDMDVTENMAVIVGSSYNESFTELVDLTDPTHPASIAKLFFGFGGYPEAAIMDQLLIAGQREAGMYFYDISDPNAPERLGFLDDPCIDMIGYDGHLYIANGAAGMAIYTSPDGHTLTKQGAILGIGSAEDISLEDGIIAIADGGHHGYYYDWIYGGLAVSELIPGQPLSVKGNFPEDEYRVGAGAYTTIDGDSAYLVGGSCTYRVYICSERFFAINISQPSAPTLIGNYVTLGYEKNRPYAGQITVHEKYAYLPRVYIDSIMSMGIFDVGQPVTPTLVNSIPYAYGIAITANYGLISTPLGILVMDISDPISLTLTSYTPIDRLTQPIIEGSLGFLGGLEDTDKDNFLQIFDPANLPVIDILAEVETSATVYDVAFDGRFAYVANGEAGLTLYDLTNPSAPVKSFTYDTAGTAKRVILDGEYVYLADGDGGLLVFRKTYLYPQAYLPLVPSQVQILVNYTK